MAVAALGYVGGVITTLGGVPQIVKMIQTRKTQDVSWGMLGCWTTGLSMTLAYAVTIGQPPVYLSGSTSLLMTIIMSAIKYQCEGAHQNQNKNVIKYTQVQEEV